MFRTFGYIVLVLLPVAACAEPITLGTMAVIAGISALASAGGAAMSAYGGAKEGRENRKLQKRFHKDQMDNSAAGIALQSRELDMQERQYKDAKPGQALQMISGLSDLQEKRSKSGNYLESIRALARR